MSICLRGRKGGFSSIHQLVDVGGGLFRYRPLVHYKVDVSFFRFSTNCEMDTVRVEGVSSIESIVGLCSDAFTNCGVVSWSWWMVCVEWE